MKVFRSLKRIPAALAIAFLLPAHARIYCQEQVLPNAPRPQLLAQNGQPPASSMQPAPAQQEPVSSQTNRAQSPVPTGPKLTLSGAERMAIQHNPNVSIAHLLQLAQGKTMIVATHDPVLAARMDRVIALDPDAGAGA